MQIPVQAQTNPTPRHRCLQEKESRSLILKCPQCSLN